MEQSKAMEYKSRKASSDVLKPRNMYRQGVPGGKDLPSGESSLGQTIPI
jgi:hypothetical protein